MEKQKLEVLILQNNEEILDTIGSPLCLIALSVSMCTGLLNI